MSEVMAFCGYCRVIVPQARGSRVARALREGKPLYCNRSCFVMARRSPLTPDQKKERKRAYDARRRIEKRAEISATKAAYHRRTYDPDKERERRAQNMDRHIEYCRQPDYRAYKADYDRERRAEEYGDYADAYLLLLGLERELRERATGYERRKARGYYTRSAKQRRRELWKTLTTLKT